MRKLLCAFQIVFLFFFISSTYASIDKILGWGKTIWGMTEEEVLKVEHRAFKFPNPEIYPECTPSIGIKKIRIGTAEFDVKFLFWNNDKKLMKVIFSSFEKENYLINEKTFANIEKLLTEKYGVPTYKDPMKEISWNLSNTSIELHHFRLRSQSEINIYYKPIKSSLEESKDL